MLFLTILVLVIILDQVFERIHYNYNYDYWPTFITFFVSLFSLLILWGCICDNNRFINSYNEIKKIYDKEITNTSITGEEKAKLMEFCVENNKEILIHKKYYKNWFIGCYYSKKIANLETLYFNKLIK